VSKKIADVVAAPMHPHTIKYLQKGHPWVTKDSFSSVFPKEALMLRPKQQNNDGHYVLMHDPAHQQIKARLWKYAPGQWMGYTKGAFKHDLSQRLVLALNKRIESGVIKDRENWYWCFGEADQLPGLHIVYLKNVLWVQFYAHFWKRWQRDLIALLDELIREHFANEKIIPPKILALQMRVESNDKTEAPLVMMEWSTWKKIEGPIEWNITEQQIQLKLTMGERYDGGIYTDMAHVRSLLPLELADKKNVLNLFCYTGAFSLWALKNKAAQVFSVDLSAWALERLEENIALNANIFGENCDKRNHSWRVSVSQSLHNLVQNNISIDTIICDPPPISSDGQKKQTAIEMYRQLLPTMAKVLAPKGTIIMISNLHHQTRAQWEKAIAPLLEKSGLKIEKRFQLGGDCPTISGFPEGDYLKILMLKKI
jgi:23S rRNA (cytosine1962-C5)-methyltransferase